MLCILAEVLINEYCIVSFNVVRSEARKWNCARESIREAGVHYFVFYPRPLDRGMALALALALTLALNVLALLTLLDIFD